ncbi:MAG: glycosyltransferase [Parachlamydia sp.]|nr:glycosyltransferase [Parachlamydia sp.]
MLKKVCFIVNYNLYESKRHFTRKLAEAMNRKGIETRIIDVQESALSAEAIATIRRYGPDLTCSFNSLLPVSETKFLWDALEIPHLAILVDPAIYSIHLARSPYSILSCVDRDDCAEVKNYQFENVFFWPHAVERDLMAGDPANRPYDVVFLGSCYDYESLRASWRQRNTEGVNKVLDDAIDLFFGDPTISLAHSLVKAWNATKADPAGVDFTALYYYLDNYTRGKDRVELIRSIKNAHVHVFGDLSTDTAVGILGWPQYLASQPNVTVHPSVPFGQALQIMKQSKVCLNSAPFFKNGSHERVFTGLACGSAVITSESRYFREAFQEGEELLFYSMSDRSAVDGMIEKLLKDDSGRIQMAAKGREKVMAGHTWDHRVDQLLQELPAISGRIYAKLQSSNSPPE